MIQLKVSGLFPFVCLHQALTTRAQSMLNCIDNSGAALVECVKVLKMKRAAKIGQHAMPFPLSRLDLTTRTRRPHHRCRPETAQLWS